jgi:TonB-linked SusC/RagA family outer membrane protein
MLGSIPLAWRTKLGTAVLTACLMQANAMAFGQRVTVKMKDVTVVSLLKEIRKQSNVDVFYDAKTLSDSYKVSVDLKNADIKEVLELALKGLPLTYQVTTEGITIRKGQRDAAVTKGTELQATIDMEGRIVGQNGQPLAGATVSVKGLGKSVQTTANGSFVLKNVPDGEILVVSYVGYLSKELIGRSQLGNIVLTVLDNPLDAVQVIGYGKTSKRLTTGAVATVRAEDLEKQPVSNPLQALSGRVAGVYISEGSGVAGSGVSMVIRGKNTINAGSEPLYIVDGVPFTAIPTELTSGQPVPNPLLGGSFSPFDNIPTSDIESIDILKDADATAIYGSRAANGVVMITTKKGKAGAMKVGVNVYTGATKITNGLEMLKTEDYLNIRRKAFENDKSTPTLANAPDLLSFGDGYTDFVDHVMGNMAGVTDGTVSFSGGSVLSQYLISANYRHQTSVFPGSFKDNKATLRFNLQSQTENGKFGVNLSGAYTKNINNLPSAGVNNLYALPPNLPLYKEDGNLYWHNSYANPVAALLAPMDMKTDNILLNSSLKYKIIPGLEFKTDVGFNRINLENIRALTRNARNPNTTTTGQVTYTTNYNQNFTVEPQLTYQRTLGPGRLESLVGSTFMSRQSVQPLLMIGTFTNDLLYNHIPSITTQFMNSGNVASRYLSVFGRLNYVMNNRYIVNLNGRRDGASRFGPGKRFGNFGSVGAAWVISEESFVKDQMPWVSFAKIRSSYGTIGNEPTEDYRYMSLYTSSLFEANYDGVSALNPERLGNKDFRWEVTRKLEVAMDLNFIKDRVSFSAAWYRNRSNNLLINIPMAAQTGFSEYMDNLGALVENKGVELNLNTQNIKKKDFSWSSSINFTVAKNRLVDYPDLESSEFANYYVMGQSLSVEQGYHFLGFKDGIAEFEDLDGDGVISSGSYVTTGIGDHIVLGNTDPKFYGGFQNNFSYKNFSLDFLFSFVKKDGYNIYNSYTSYVPGMANNLVADVLNKPFRYTMKGNSAAGIAYNRYKTSDATFGDASFIRLKNISLTYQFNEKQLKFLKLKQLNVYARGQNLWTITNYLGYDPETLGTAIPPMKMYTIGLQTSF